MAAACQLVGPCWLQNESLMAFMTVYACQTHVIAWLLSLWNMEDAHVMQNPPHKQSCKVLCRRVLLLRTSAQALAAHLCSAMCPAVQQSSRCASQGDVVGWLQVAGL